MKINSFGDTIWTKIIGTSECIAMACSYSQDGGCVLSGYGTQTWTSKVDRNGNLIWFKMYPGFDTQIYRLTGTTDGGYVASGRINSSSTVVFKINTSGDLNWINISGSDFSRIYKDIKEIKDGFIITGNLRDSILNKRFPIICKLNFSGELLWEKRYEIFDRVAANSINCINNNQYLVGGIALDSSGIRNNGFVMRTDTEGEILFSIEFNSFYSESFLDISIIDVNKYVIAGIKYSGLNLYGKATIIDSLGNVIIEKEFPSPSFIELRRVLPISNGDIIFTGVGELCQFDCEDVFAVRTDSVLNYIPLSISTNYNIIPSFFKLYPAYPNPFNPVTNVEFAIPKQGFVSLKVYDMLGKEVATLLNENLSPGNFTVNFNGSNFSSGVYFCKMESGEFKDIKRMVMIK